MSITIMYVYLLVQSVRRGLLLVNIHAGMRGHMTGRQTRRPSGCLD